LEPFGQCQQAGVRTAQLDLIMRQQATELLKAIERLSRNETTISVQMLRQDSVDTQ